MTDASPPLSTPATDADPSTNTATIADQRRVRRARWVAAGRAATGLFALLDPQRALVPSQRASTAARRVVRVLGARHLVQAGVEAAIPTPTVLTIGAGVDAVHAVTCLGFAAFGGARWRREALVNAVTALGFCAVTATTARTHTAHPPTPGSPRPIAYQGAHA
jgi:hypothetical protein